MSSKSSVHKTKNNNNNAPNHHHHHRQNVNNNSDRAQTYRRQFLAQFDINAPELSDDIFHLLYNEFGNFHVLNSCKCRPTDIACKLKARNLSTHQSIKLSRIFNGEPMILMTSILIDALVQRFEDVSIAAAAMQPSFGKLPSFEILTHCFLRAEQRDDLAAIFFIHKSATVLSAPDVRLRKLIDKCYELSANGTCLSNWSNVPRSG